ncbi:MAG: META domain-containing protein [Burkholderiaceae bacterium]|jgi:heat shock protein HslJ|nr:META domain-containing protein [Burkholderiales bacterium]MCZ8340935.1 META domain-containing protein [Burkholderiaceae bacterium]
MTSSSAHALAACPLAACLLAACLLAATLAAGCATKPASSGAVAPPPPAAPPPFEGTAWTLASLEGRPVPSGSDATLRFEGERVSGSDGCNRFAGPWSGRGTSLRIGPNLAATQRACPDAQRALADAYGRALIGATAWRIDGTTLRLLGDGGTPLAALEPQPTGLAGTAWRIVAYNTGRQSVTSVGVGAPLTIEFGTAGGVRGSAGCNTYSGAWTESAGRVTIGPLRTTRMACADPPDVMEREAAVLRALESVATARREGDRLELRTATGAIAVSSVEARAR